MCQKGARLVQTSQGVFYVQCCQTSGQNPKSDYKKLTQGILTQSLLASANGQHREECLSLGTITSAEDCTVCMLSILAYIMPCSRTNKL